MRCLACGHDLCDERFHEPGILGLTHHVCPESHERARKAAETRDERKAERELEREASLDKKLRDGFDMLNAPHRKIKQGRGDG